MRRLVTGLTNLTWITAGYGWFTLVAPIIAAAPLYFAGDLLLRRPDDGGRRYGFNQVQSSLRWFVDNFSTIADWRATLLRVAGFRRALLTTDSLHEVESRISFSEGEPGSITIKHLEIASPAGCTMLAEKSVNVRAGDRVLIVGEPGAGKTLLFRTLAGLWPWGAGEVVRPKGEEILYMPRDPYLPPGTLRQVLAYPMNVDEFSALASKRALVRLGLERLTPMLEESREWERELADDEQHSLV